MKRHILLLAAVLFGSVGCFDGPDPDKILYESSWQVVNSTDETLQISPAPFGQHTPYFIKSGEKITFYSRSEYRYSPYFGMVLVCWRNAEPEKWNEINFDVMDSDGVLLKRWNIGGDRFSYGGWVHSGDLNKRKHKKDIWTFEITEEGLLPEPEPTETQID